MGRQNLAVGITQVGVTAGSGPCVLLVSGIALALFWEAGCYVAAVVGVIVATIVATQMAYEPQDAVVTN